MKVKAFAGNKDQIWSLYYKLLLTEKLNVELAGDARVAVLKVEPKDYIRALAVGTKAIMSSNLDSVIWINPEGDPKANIQETHDATLKNVKLRQMVAFTSYSAIEANTVASYLKKMADIETITERTENGIWEIVVPTEDYFQAVSIGAKVADGRKFSSVRWNSPTGEMMFDVSSLAEVARKENDEALEA